MILIVIFNPTPCTNLKSTEVTVRSNELRYLLDILNEVGTVC